ncbi:hypothetical protein [Pseudovibrio sp. W64]|uniref:hypothetical protein n=1 Tax=Pseudovibrio sp. W64 TaxID=1735583 RepID=UPI0007AE6D9A|nr:hypothetical protein [Pseudovibrio sp. W64]
MLSSQEVSKALRSRGDRYGKSAVELEYPAVSRAEESSAASYCGLSATSFLANCPVPAVLLSGGRKVWDVKDLDRWIVFVVSTYGAGLRI